MRLWVNMLQSRSFLYWVWPNPVSRSACLCVCSCFACVCKQPADSRGNGQVLLHLSLHFSPLESNISLGSRLPSYNTPGSSPSTHTHTLHYCTSAPCTSTSTRLCCRLLLLQFLFMCVCIFKSVACLFPRVCFLMIVGRCVWTHLSSSGLCIGTADPAAPVPSLYAPISPCCFFSPHNKTLNAAGILPALEPPLCFHILCLGAA